jgi:hypothetical protein
LQRLDFVNKEEKIMANYIPKAELLQKAVAELNGVSDSFDVSVKGDNIVVTSKWLNGTVVGAGGVESMRETATTIYTIKDNSKYKWHDVLDSGHASIGVNGISLSNRNLPGNPYRLTRTYISAKTRITRMAALASRRQNPIQPRRTK